MFHSIKDARVCARAAVAGVLTAAVSLTSASPAFAHEDGSHDGDTYTVEALNHTSLPEGGEVVRENDDDLPTIETASAPGAWLSGAGPGDINIVHTVQEGESLGSIAGAYGFDESAGWRILFDANEDVDQPAHVWPGLELTVPAHGDELTHRAVPEPPAPEPEAESATGEREQRARASRNASRSSTGGAATVSGGRWDTLAACESGGNWSINTGNGYYGGLQFSVQSWRAVGGTGYPHQASKAEQIKRAEMLLSRQGWGAWPACTRKLGWR